MKPSSRDKVRRQTELRSVFSKYDADSSGDVDVKELQNIFRELGVEKSVDDINSIICQSSSSGLMKLNFAEFENLFSVSQMLTIFRELDKDNSGQIQRDEIRVAMNKLGHRLSPRQCDDLLSKLDTDGDNRISFEEFKAFFENLPLATLESVAQYWMSNVVLNDCGNDMSPTLPAPGSGLEWWQTVLAGGCGGVLSRTLTAPLEKIKINAQTGLGGGGGIVGELLTIHSSEGIRGLFAGNLANCLRVFPTAGITCTCYLNLLALTPADAEMDAMEPVYRLTCGGVAALVGNSVTYPLDLIRAKLTITPRGGEVAPTLLGSIKSIYASGGSWRGFYTGIRPTLLAVVPFVAIQNTSIDLLRDRAIEMDLQPTPVTLLLVGALAGIVAQSVVYPLDVLRRRMQVQPLTGGKANVNVLSDKTWLAMKSVVDSHGYKSLYAGIGATFVKTIPAVAIVAAVTGTMNGYFKQQNSRR